MEGKDGRTKWGNLIGYIIFPFSIKMYKDPLDYIRKGKENADRKKNSLEAILTYKSADLIVKCFGIKVCIVFKKHSVLHCFILVLTCEYYYYRQRQHCVTECSLTQPCRCPI